MRVWVAYEKVWHDFPAIRWTCEWYELRGDAPEDPDPLEDTECNTRSFGPKGKGLAIHYAETRACKRNYFGCSQVYREHLEILEGNVAVWEKDRSTSEEVVAA